MSITAFHQKIKEASIITIFRHTHPDGDALGSQFGLKTWIQETYPEKQVYCLGFDKGLEGRFPDSDVISDELVQNSLAIILDCANSERVDDDRYKLAKDSLRVDHHPHLEHYCALELVDTTMAATCEYLLEILSDSYSKACATWFMYGLLTDTMSFKTTNTTAHSLEMAARCCNAGVNISEASRYIFTRSYEDFSIASLVRQKVQIEQCVAYVKLNKDELAELNLDYNHTKDFVNEFMNVEGIDIWCIFTESPEGIWTGSLRAKEAPVNVLAQKYHGGGHKNASGVNHLTEQDVMSLLSDLKGLLK